MADFEIAPDRRTAKVRGELVYFNGKTCPNGHTVLRYTSNGACSGCLNVKSYIRHNFTISNPAPKICQQGHSHTSKQCPVCRKKWHQLDAKAHRVEYTRRQLKKCHQVRLWLNRYKESHPCTDCHKYFPHYQMEFDHIEHRNGDLTKSVGRAVNTASIKAVIKAIAPCDLVCALCHASRTYFRCGKCLSCKSAIAERLKSLPTIITKIEQEYGLNR